MRSLNTPPRCAMLGCANTARYRVKVCNHHWMQVDQNLRTAILDAWRQHDYATEHRLVDVAVAGLRQPSR